MPDRFTKISVIGAGRVGTALALKLRSRRYLILSVVNQSKRSAQRSAKILKAQSYSDTSINIDRESELIIIATPPQEIPNIVRTLTKHRSINFQKTLIVHTSGVHSSKILEPLRKKGASIGALHPIQTFPKSLSSRDALKNLKNIYYGIDAPPVDLPKVKSLVRMLGGNYIVIPEIKRALYHALCVFSSGYMVQLLSIIKELSKQSSFPKPWYNIMGPLMNTSIRNAMETSPMASLTGPIMRGDSKTVKLHIKALKKYQPSSVKLYKTLGTETTRLAYKNKLIIKSEYRELLKILSP
ncbi:MAG: Rossmann-like and DUF2520 domain-containing protein [Bacteroidota bacterium]